MPFQYKKSNEPQGNDSFWTSYSDLFLGLSTIFLLLYVTSSLRTGTDAIQNQITNQKLSMQVDELQHQLKAYEAIKADYMQKQAQGDEQQEYQELMDKLTLLQSEATNEKERLARESLENEKKAKALNKYQQMIRNVLNANKVAKSRIQVRNGIIGEQDVEISNQQKSIADLNQEVTQKKQMIQEGEEKIEKARQALEQNVARLKQSYKANKVSKTAYEKQLAKLKADSRAKVSSLEKTNADYGRQLDSLSAELGQTQAQLGQTQAKLGQTKNDLNRTQAALGEERERSTDLEQSLGKERDRARGLSASLHQKEGEAENLRGQIGSIQKGFAAQQAKDKAAFEAQLSREKLDGAARAAREGEFRANAEKKAQDLQGKLAGLQGQLKDTEGALARAKSEIDARREVARDIKKAFAKAGVKADVDMGTGEVVLDFGDSYFDSNSAGLKSEMKKVLEKAMPAYSQSLFGNPKIASKVSTVEIIGFASPTYKGRYVDPTSDNPEDKAALKYNMDLSYRRANSIFSYLLEKPTGAFQHQKQLLSRMKVSGRSFLEVMEIKKRDIANAAEFCRVNDCRKAQRVIVRFGMNEKKQATQGEP